MSHILLAGAGNMGFAMLSTWSKIADHCLTVIEPNDSLRERAASLGVKTHRSPDELAADAVIDVLVIATKPQVVGEIVARYEAHLAHDALLISVAAGVGLGAMAACTTRAFAIVRAMPNTPASIGEGMIVCCPNTQADTTDFKDIARHLLSPIGRVAFVEDEALMDAVTAVSGSGPAYIFHLIEALALAGVKAGLPRDLAMLLAKQTVYGSAKLAIESETDPSALRQQVTSPNGTTAAALCVLMAETGGLVSLMTAAIEAATKRSIELGR
ncbi:pyrroline-5-carboxylate reductase (plasmid) [Agrobacterium radiobacter]|uniref:Pyrroline-5-carboxylate reductase n=1 Tax=Agrobacterium tumefaciens str. B6 TaxID=1183423 RepID=A0A822VBX3_AGRTU|nr:pyrroline-5-carboxylate reductase [Agrobacterium tumefaciens]MQB27788.1 pyrroline-5-carboxylate reductase [Agrobacterium tumefaciens]NTA08438.1 pyrroline-5-carboxylate reductase [Agrobacterium tumefaciens]NTB16260.1 pyrroline-5-carboxylate reductase [Agrobacterium tumefaciens]CVI25308.1 Pyrroline-5-carboxylate reductase protein [Agrobacterium tumefaciens str. B6]